MNKFCIVIEGTNVENFNSVEELILAQNQLKIIDSGYQELGIETPSWVTDKMGEIGHEISVRVKGEVMRRLRAAKARRSALRSADEKRLDLDAEIANLESRLG